MSAHRDRTLGRNGMLRAQLPVKELEALDLDNRWPVRRCCNDLSKKPWEDPGLENMVFTVLFPPSATKKVGKQVPVVGRINGHSRRVAILQYCLPVDAQKIQKVRAPRGVEMTVYVDLFVGRSRNDSCDFSREKHRGTNVNSAVSGNVDSAVSGTKTGEENILAAHEGDKLSRGKAGPIERKGPADTSAHQ